MPKINFELPVPVNNKTAFKKIKDFFKGDNDIKRFDAKASCTFDEDHSICHLKGSQFSAKIQTTEINADKTNVNVEIDIPLSLVLFKGKIKELVEKNIKKVFKT